jgi:hypothetical protein
MGTKASLGVGNIVGCSSALALMPELAPSRSTTKMVRVFMANASLY